MSARVFGNNNAGDAKPATDKQQQSTGLQIPLANGSIIKDADNNTIITPRILVSPRAGDVAGSSESVESRSPAGTRRDSVGSCCTATLSPRPSRSPVHMKHFKRFGSKCSLAESEADTNRGEGFNFKTTMSRQTTFLTDATSTCSRLFSRQSTLLSVNEEDESPMAKSPMAKNLNKNRLFVRQETGMSSVSAASSAVSHGGTSPSGRQIVLDEDGNRLYDGLREEECTTLMVRNIPNKYSQRMVLDVFEKYGFKGSFDFLYVPSDFATRVNVGYCFVNFIEAKYAQQFARVFHRLHLQGFKSKKLVQISLGTVQGMKNNIAKFKDSTLCNEFVAPEFHPLIFNTETGEEIPFRVAIGKKDPLPPSRVEDPDYWNKVDEEKHQPKWEGGSLYPMVVPKKPKVPPSSDEKSNQGDAKDGEDDKSVVTPTKLGKKARKKLNKLKAEEEEQLKAKLDAASSTQSPSPMSSAPETPQASSTAATTPQANPAVSKKKLLLRQSTAPALSKDQSQSTVVGGTAKGKGKGFQTQRSFNMGQAPTTPMDQHYVPKQQHSNFHLSAQQFGRDSHSHMYQQAMGQYNTPYSMQDVPAGMGGASPGDSLRMHAGRFSFRNRSPQQESFMALQQQAAAAAAKEEMMFHQMMARRAEAEMAEFQRHQSDPALHERFVAGEAHHLREQAMLQHQDPRSRRRSSAPACPPGLMDSYLAGQNGLAPDFYDSDAAAAAARAAAAAAGGPPGICRGFGDLPSVVSKKPAFSRQGSHV